MTHGNRAVSEHDSKFKYPRCLRLIRSEDFGVLVRERNENTFGTAMGVFSVSARWIPEATSGLRIGVTVGKRNCPRSIDRALIKRILKEAARHRAPQLQALLATHAPHGLDLSLRLRTPYKAIVAELGAMPAIRQRLRRDADALFDRLERQVRRGPQRKAQS